LSRNISKAYILNAKLFVLCTSLFIEVEGSPLLLIGLLYQLWMVDADDCGALVELTGETEVLRGSLPQCHFVHHNSHMTLLWA
jgi:hypothetical protein